MQKQVLLINPRTPDGCGKSYYLPLGLLYLASICEKIGFSCNLLDFNIHIPYTHSNPDEYCNQLLLRRLSEVQPDIVLLGCLFSGQFSQVVSVANTIKDSSPRTLTLLGGIHATTYPVDILSNCLNIDYIVIGEGENTLERFLLKFQHGDSNYYDMDGFAFRDSGGSVVINHKTKFIRNLDEIPFPAYHLVDMNNYFINTIGWHNPKGLKIKASAAVITSRGCPMKCSFCPMSSVMGKKYRLRSVENVFNELILLHSKYGYTYFSFMDDNLTLDKDFTLRLCNLIIDNKLDIQFDTPNGISINSLDEEMIDALAKAGLVRVAIAIESGSQLIREYMGKYISEQKIQDIVGAFKKHPSVFIRAFFIMGMPEDTHDTLNQTYEMIRKINVDSSEVANLIVFPGTKVFSQAARDHLFFDKIRINDLWKTSYVLSKRDYFMIKPYQLNLDELTTWRIKFDQLANPTMLPQD